MPSAISLPLEAASNVVVSSPTDEQVLTWDAATSRWINADSGGGSDSSGGWTYYTFLYNDSSPVTLITVPANKRVLSAILTISTAFNGTSPTLAIGSVASSGIVMATTQNNPAEAGTYETNPATSWGTATALRLTINAGVGATAGAGMIALQIQE